MIKETRVREVIAALKREIKQSRIAYSQADAIWVLESAIEQAIESLEREDGE